MKVGRVRVSAYPELKPGDKSAVFYYRAKVDWVDRRVSFMLPVGMPTQEEAVDKGVDLLDWLKDTFGEEYELI